jgi:transcriptional regulator with XRE-family HTH domain
MKNTKNKINEMQVRKSVGHNLKNYRLENGLSQMALAAKASLELSTIHRIESGKTDTQLSTLSRISKALNVSWNQLLQGV